MKCLTAKNLENMADDELVYVNRNTLNATIAEYEIKIDLLKCYEELEMLLELWKNTYESEMKGKRINPFIEMKTKDIKKCFINYKKMPKGSFCMIYR